MKPEQSVNSPEILLSLATIPVLFGMVAMRSLGIRLQDISQASEEIFRGDRLPLLHFHESESES
ncbi:MAG: hypothetical protein SW833_19095 [Cyanobacteriota bacterium]|nr:hypothetical protein [Cyanobacteriota bacterium]